MDLYPTLLELAGLPKRPEQHLDGRSLVTAIQGTPSSELESRFLAWHYPHRHGSGHTPSNAIRKGRWKLIHHVDPVESFELYDLENDIGEKEELSKINPDKAEELATELADWVKSTQAEAARSKPSSFEE